MNWKAFVVPPVVLAGALSLKSCAGTAPPPVPDPPMPPPMPPPIVAPVDPTPPPPPQPPPAVVKTEAEQVIALVNAERRSRGQVELKYDATLTRAAQEYAELMARKDRLSHTLDGSVWHRIEALGYEYSTCGENIAWNHRDAGHVMEGWMDSPGHKANILKADFREIGVGIAVNERGEKYHCQVFGTPR